MTPRLPDQTILVAFKSFSVTQLAWLDTGFWVKDQQHIPYKNVMVQQWFQPVIQWYWMITMFMHYYIYKEFSGITITGPNPKSPTVFVGGSCCLHCKKKIRHSASADFWVLSTYFCRKFSTFCCINLKQGERTEKSAEAGGLKIVRFLFLFFLTV